MHSDRPQLQTGSGNLAVETKRNAFVGLQAQGDGVGVKFGAALGREEDVRRGSELDPNFARTQGQAFTRAQIKWNARPAPIVDRSTKRDEGFDVRVRSHFRLMTISDSWLAIDFAFDVLGPDD